MKKDKLVKSGANTQNATYRIALAGNPNTGKSTVFNYLTGLKQHTGNWPGKTVARAEGSFSYKQEKYKLIDLPGTYSLLSTSEDEEIARNFILFGSPDVTLIVADATRLERNLNLVLQILEITGRAILIVNLMDEAERNKITVDIEALRRRLKIPVVGAAARSGRGMDDLLAEIDKMVHTDQIEPPHRIQTLSGQSAEAVEAVTREIETLYPDLPNTRWVALRLLDGDARVRQALRTGNWVD